MLSGNKSGYQLHLTDVNSLPAYTITITRTKVQGFNFYQSCKLAKLQEILQADGVDVSRESYSLNWLGKSYARVLANEPIRTMLSEDTEHNEQKQNKNSHNLLIQGDNLEVLKHLKGAYSEKIKMIYIDPPYLNAPKTFM